MFALIDPVRKKIKSFTVKQPLRNKVQAFVEIPDNAILPLKKINWGKVHTVSAKNDYNNCIFASLVSLEELLELKYSYFLLISEDWYDTIYGEDFNVFPKSMIENKNTDFGFLMCDIKGYVKFELNSNSYFNTFKILGNVIIDKSFSTSVFPVSIDCNGHKDIKSGDEISTDPINKLVITFKNLSDSTFLSWFAVCTGNKV